MRTILSVGLICVATSTHGFEVDLPVLGGETVHEDLTRDAVLSVSATWRAPINNTALQAVIAGVVNPDSQMLEHKVGDDLNDYHVNNANMSNGQFERTFRLIRDLLDDAIALSRNNPQVLQPRNASLQGFVSNLQAACREATDICGVFGGLPAIPGVLSINHRADPHTSGAPLNQLRLRLPALINAVPAAMRTDLRALQQALKAYVARQYLGHALHALQDVFAHSNFIELLNARNGPPCGRSEPEAANLCANAVPGRPARFGDPQADAFLRALASGFNLRTATFRNALSTSRRERLQTGYVNAAYGPVNMCPDLLPLPNGFEYCHWSSRNHPALNKDKPGSDEASHESHAYALELALFASEILWEHFLRASALTPGVNVNVSRSAISEPPNRLGTSRVAAALILTLPQPLHTELTVEVTQVPNGRGRGATRCQRGVDFLTNRSTANFPRGAVRAQAPLVICHDTLVESNEQFLAVVRGEGVAANQFVVTITDNDRYPVPVLSRVKLIPASNKLKQVGAQLELSGSNFQRSSYAEMNGRRLSASFQGSSRLLVRLEPGLANGRYTIAVVTPRGGRSASRPFQLGSPLRKSSR